MQGKEKIKNVPSTGSGNVKNYHFGEGEEVRQSKIEKVG
jgi:hypothetical protein